MSYNANDEKQVKKARADAELAEALRLDVVRDVMKSAAGRFWIYGELFSRHIFSTTFVPGSPDISAFKEGERNSGLRLLADIQSAAPDQYALMLKEAKDHQK